MRKLFLLMAISCSVMAFGQGAKETLRLTNGELVKGWITDSIPGKSLTLLNKDGEATEYNYEDIQAVLVYSDKYDYHYRPGLDYELMAGYMQFTDAGGGGAMPVELTVGKRFSKNYLAGVGVGGIFVDKNPFGHHRHPLIPVTATFKAIFPLNAYRFEPFVQARGGYVFNTNSPKYLGYETPDYLTFSIMPGFQIPITEQLDFLFSAGYTHHIPLNSDIAKSAGILTVTVGIGFHQK